MVLDRTRITPGIAVGDDRFHARWTTDSDDPFEALTAEIAVFALTAVTGHAAVLLHKCEASRCMLFFTRLDARQHWCSDVCGNRARLARSAKTNRESSTAQST
ncbi:CGNR zinc finger domain-containing protein [Rhodococcus pyridinivorans]|uniref:CGNR zinc finger domain-containing protein n=1 Tax=Rhodococcus pyridinivorans TaxID=103816 RepID=UPI0007611B12